MAEDSDSTGAKSIGGGGTGGGDAVDPLAISLALGAAAHDARVAAKAEAFLENQTVLSARQIAIADLQIAELKRDDRLRH